MRSAWWASSKEMNKLNNKSVHTCPVQTWPGQEVFIYSHPYPRYSWETGWEICSNQLEETSPIDRKNVWRQVHKTTNEQSPTRKKRERNSGWFQVHTKYGLNKSGQVRTRMSHANFWWNILEHSIRSKVKKWRGKCWSLIGCFGADRWLAGLVHCVLQVQAYKRSRFS